MSGPPRTTWTCSGRRHRSSGARPCRAADREIPVPTAFGVVAARWKPHAAPVGRRPRREEGLRGRRRQSGWGGHPASAATAGPRLCRRRRSPQGGRGRAHRRHRPRRPVGHARCDGGHPPCVHWGDCSPRTPCLPFVSRSSWARQTINLPALQWRTRSPQRAFSMCLTSWPTRAASSISPKKPAAMTGRERWTPSVRSRPPRSHVLERADAQSITPLAAAEDLVAERFARARSGARQRNDERHPLSLKDVNAVVVSARPASATWCRRSARRRWRRRRPRPGARPAARPQRTALATQLHARLVDEPEAVEPAPGRWPPACVQQQHAVAGEGRTTRDERPSLAAPHETKRLDPGHGEDGEPVVELRRCRRQPRRQLGALPHGGPGVARRHRRHVVELVPARSAPQRRAHGVDLHGRVIEVAGNVAVRTR